MRYLLYTFAFCLSCYFFFDPQFFFVRTIPRGSHELAEHVVHEYKYIDISLQRIQQASAIADMLLEKQEPRAAEEWTFRGVKGIFYRAPSVEGVLYCPLKNASSLLGRGCHKKVYRAIYFTKNQAEVVAACFGDHSIVEEGKALRLVSLGTSSSPFRCFFQITQDKYVLVIRYCNLGGLSSLRKKGVTWTLSEKLLIAQDLVRALLEIHRKGLAHCDLHDGNILLHRTKEGMLHAALIDFGRARSLYSKKKDRPQGARTRNPPEVLSQPFKSINKKQADIFALGCCFFKLFFNQEYTPVRLYDVHEVKKMDNTQRLAHYERVIQEHEAICSRIRSWISVSENGACLEPLYEKILLMVHPDPRNRAECEEVIEILDNVMKQNNSSSCLGIQSRCNSSV